MTAPRPMPDGPRRLVLVPGVGRTGTSLFTAIAGMAGFHVPQPEIDADPTKPQGHGVPQWVVEFHDRQLRSRQVSVWDSRPAAWQEAARAADDPAALAELRGWLEVQFVGRDAVVVKDPRIGWFLPLWERAAQDVGLEASFAMVLWHPLEAGCDDLKPSGYWEKPASKTTSWVNIMLGTEHATRGRKRVFIRHDDLLSDWPGQVARAGEALGVPLLRHLSADDRDKIDSFVDPTLLERKAGFDMGLPEPVGRIIESMWKQMLALALPGGDNAETAAALDVSRAAYHAYCAEIEAIPQSSVHALGQADSASARDDAGKGKSTASHGGGADAVIRLAERVLPRRVLRRVPPLWRARVVRAVTGAGRLMRR